MDTLKDIPRSDLIKLLDIFRANWPYGVEGFCLLKTQLDCPDLTDIYKYRFYSLDEDISQGMVAISDQEHYYEVYICPSSNSSIPKFESVLCNTTALNWNRNVAVSSANDDVLNCLRRIKAKIGLQLDYDERVCKHLLNKNATPFDIGSPPDNTYVGHLKPEYIDLVNRTWTYCSGEHSYNNFETLMKKGLTYVLYSTEDNKPVSWIMVDNAGAFTHLYCLGVHRRKGYAEYITKVATNDLLKRGKDVLAYTLENNMKPQNLFNKLGFENLGYVWWVFVTKDNSAK